MLALPAAHSPRAPSVSAQWRASARQETLTCCPREKLTSGPMGKWIWHRLTRHEGGGHGATAARLIPDQMAGDSNLSALLLRCGTGAPCRRALARFVPRHHGFTLVCANCFACAYLCRCLCARNSHAGVCICAGTCACRCRAPQPGGGRKENRLRDSSPRPPSY